MALPDDGELSGKVALITGAARNIGAGIATELAAAGAAVAINVRTLSDEADALAAGINDHGGRAMVLPADVGDPEDVDALIQAVESRFGRLDILVNNASSRVYRPLEELTTADWRDVMASNLDAAFFCAQAAVPVMRRSGGGAIVNIGGQAAHSGGLGRAAIAAAKAGLVGLTRALAIELAPAGIRVNCLSPGIIETGRELTPALAQAAARVPLGRLGEIGEIAATVRFLCSPGGAYITGQTIQVNGGAYLG